MRLGAYAKPSIKYLTRAAAARQLQMRPQIITRLYEGGQLAGVMRPMGKRSLLLVERSSTRQFECDRFDELTFQEASALLGVSERPMRALIVRDIVKPKRGNPTNRSRIHVFSKRELEQLIVKLPHTENRQQPDTDLISFAQTTQKLSAIEISSADIIHYVSKHKLTPRKLDLSKQGFARWMFARTEIDQLIAETRDASKRHLTIPKAAQTLGMKQEVMYNLVNQGHIQTKTTFIQKRRKRVVSASELRGFEKKYVPATSLAKAANTSPKHLIYQLRKESIRPAIGPMVDGNRQTYFKRADTAKARMKVASGCIANTSHTSTKGTSDA